MLQVPVDGERVGVYFHATSACGCFSFITG